MAQDYTRYAWLSLLIGSIDVQAVAAGEQANSIGKATNLSALHTLACLYAAQDRTAEARQCLLQAMSAAHLVEPDSNTWLGFGLIYEQYGLTEAALAAYGRVPQPTVPSPADTYTLAQRHINLLKQR